MLQITLITQKNPYRKVSLLQGRIFRGTTLALANCHLILCVTCMNRHILLLLLLSAYIFQICNSGVKFKYYLNLNVLSAMTHSLCKENNILSAFAMHRLSLFPFCAFALLIFNFTQGFGLCQEKVFQMPYLVNNSVRQKGLYKLHMTAGRLSVICTILSIGQMPDMNEVSSQEEYFQPYYIFWHFMNDSD